MTPEALIIESLFRVSNKDGVDCDFILNSVQRSIDDNLTGHDIIPKARQEGVSMYFLARYTAACLSRRNVKAVVISHEAEATQRMLARVRYFIDNIRGPKPVIRNNSANEITFPKMNSMFYIGTAGAKKFGRGDTISHLHCSEFAYWLNVKELSAGLFQAVPLNGEIAIESTGNGMNDYAQRCLRAAKGQSRYKLHFFNWQDFPEYRMPLLPGEEEILMASLNKDWEEDKLVGFLSPEQIKWRRMKLEELEYDVKKFKQEYPMTLDECFQSTGSSIFYRVLYAPTPAWVKHKEWDHSWILEGHPNPVCTYLIGADVAGGVERDSSSIEVFCIETMEQVGEFDHNKIAPDVFAFEIIKWGNAFNCAYCVVEQNNHGLVTLAYMRGKYPANMIHSTPQTQGTAGVPRSLMKMGVRTSVRSKPLMIGKLRKHLADEIVIHSPLLNAQLSTFVEKEDGKLEADEGCHDDMVIAAACASWGLERGIMLSKNKIEVPKEQEPDPFSFDEILKQLKSRGRGWPIRPQHRSGEW